MGAAACVTLAEAVFFKFMHKTRSAAHTGLMINFIHNCASFTTSQQSLVSAAGAESMKVALTKRRFGRTWLSHSLT